MEVTRDIKAILHMQEYYESRGICMYKRIYVQQDDESKYFKMYDRTGEHSWRFRMWLPSDEVPHGSDVMVYASLLSI